MGADQSAGPELHDAPDQEDGGPSDEHLQGTRAALHNPAQPHSRQGTITHGISRQGTVTHGDSYQGTVTQ